MNKLNTPILFLTFNREKQTFKVFDKIKDNKPTKLYLASDGPRNISEEKVVKNIRETLINQIDWDCKIGTKFNENNLGCKKAISAAIDWFFQNEEMGIILEDDCLPNDSFFTFCNQLLMKYKDNKKIGMISGDNFQFGKRRGCADYYFSNYPHIWGWATWKDRWDKYNVNLQEINDTKFIEEIFSDTKTRKYWLEIFYKMKNEEIDTWDYQWNFTLWKENQLTIIPNKNLISNIGFGENATHTKSESKFSNIKTEEMALKVHPIEIKVNLEADHYTSKIMFHKTNIIIRILKKLKRVFS